MRKVLSPLILVVVALGCTPALASDPDGHVHFFLGQKTLDSDEWDGFNQQREFGAILSFGRSNWPVLVAVDVLTSGDEDDGKDPVFGPGSLKGGTIEIAPGVRKIWTTANAHPYLGGGLAVIAASWELDRGFATFDADSTGIGPWVSGGIFWRLGKRFNLGFDLRWSGAEVDMDFGSGAVYDDVSVGGLHAGLTMGFGW